MFFQLPEIQRVTSRVHQLQGEKQSLNNALTCSYSDGNKVRGSVGESIRSIIEKAKKDLTVCSSIEDEAENGYLIPDDFQIQQLVYDKAQLPQWFQFVFKKEYEKQKKTFDVTAKKMYKLHCLREKKNQLGNQIKSFQTLNARYEALDESEKSCLNIIAEAETLRNKNVAVVERYTNYLHLVTSKITAFLQQNVSKALNYSNQVTDYARNNCEPTIQHPKDFKSETAYTAPNTHSFSIQNRVPLRIPPPPPMPNLTPISPCHHNHNHHRPMRSVGFNESRFNYRQHMPRWMNKTLTQYYL